MIKHGKAEQSAARNVRLSAALRENLKRRKEQARGRATAGEDLAAREAGVSGDEPDFRRNPGPESGATGRPGTARQPRGVHHDRRGAGRTGAVFGIAPHVGFAAEADKQNDIERGDDHSGHDGN